MREKEHKIKHEHAPVLEVTNFGPILSGQVSPRKLTLFVGASNTGKSMYAILIYAIHQVFSNIHYSSFDFVHERLRSFGSNIDESIQRQENTLESLRSTILNLKDKKTADYTSYITVELDAEISSMMQSFLTVQLKRLVSEIERCFSTKLPDLVRYRSRGTSQITMSFGRGTSTSRCDFSYDLKKREFTLNMPSNLRVKLPSKEIQDFAQKLESMSRTPRDDHDGWLRIIDITSELIVHISKELLGEFLDESFYLPAGRTGIIHAHDMVVASIINSAPTAGLREDYKTPVITGVLADFLSELILQRRRRTFGRDGWRGASSPFDKIASSIENKTLSGTIEIEHDEITNYPHIKYRPSGWRRDIPLINASSMVAELAPIVLFLRQCVNLGDLIIIEEPEAHLHPEQQVRLTGLLIALTKLGLRVMITSHSEWIAEALGNSVSRSGGEAPHRNSKEGLEDGSSVLATDVGVWLFRTRSGRRGSIVEEIEIDDVGLYPIGYDNLAMELYNDWASNSRGQRVDSR